MRFLAMGRRALLVELDGPPAVRALAAEVTRRREAGWAPGLTDVVPGARTLLLDGVDDVPAMVRELSGWSAPVVDEDPGETVEIECCYDGVDLAAVAGHWGVAEAEAIARHASTEFTVAFCGFAPGFAYLSGLPDAWAVPRRDAPRTAIPAGSVALAGAWCGIYPRASPGGWQLIGTTRAPLWDAERDPPALLSPGQRVRFVAR